jgi:CubicO group peptidase (beta-lactamase class C family)
LSRSYSPAFSAADEIEIAERDAMAEAAEAFRRRFNAPGLSVAIARDGRTLYQQTFGVIRHDSREPLSTSHLFRVASVSKPITSAAIFSLIESGRLRSADTILGSEGILGKTYGMTPCSPIRK